MRALNTLNLSTWRQPKDEVPGAEDLAHLRLLFAVMLKKPPAVELYKLSVYCERLNDQTCKAYAGARIRWLSALALTECKKRNLLPHDDN